MVSSSSRSTGCSDYYGHPKNGRHGRQARTQFRSTAVLDWGTLHPVERLELLTTHDLARTGASELARHFRTEPMPHSQRLRLGTPSGWLAFVTLLRNISLNRCRTHRRGHDQRR